jgi:1-acyl-sn-glycerol-3-phosphate acyltransferase
MTLPRGRWRRLGSLIPPGQSLLRLAGHPSGERPGGERSGSERSGARAPLASVPQALGRAARRVREGLSFVLVISVFCTGSLVWSLIAGLLHRFAPCRATRALGLGAMGLAYRGGLALMRATGFVRMDLSSLDALRGEGPMVIVCNHLSLLDALLVISRVPNTVCIAKAALWDNPALGGSVRLAGYLRNDAPLKLVREAVRTLRDGHNLLVFPEGTRSDGSGLGPFKHGFVTMARAAGVPIQTVLLRSNTLYLSRGWKLTRMPPLPLRYHAERGPRFAPGGGREQRAAEVEAWFRDAAGPCPRGISSSSRATTPARSSPRPCAPCSPPGSRCFSSSTAAPTAAPRPSPPRRRPASRWWSGHATAARERRC